MIDTEVSPRRAQRQEHPSKGDRRERALLEAAGRLLQAGTFGDVSVAGIASEAGISRASFYFYFASKQALLASLLDEAVQHFNARIISVVASDRFDSPADAVRSTVEAAGELWWDHRTVLCASVELGSAMPEVYERTMANLSVVGAPTVALLQRYGTVPEARDTVAAEGLVSVLMLMSERSYFDLMRGDPTPAARDALTERLVTVWLRAFGLDT
ncbi:TetR/AcrR family transcriptional regulator [Lacisediminihabitans sp. FW035]